MKSTVLLAIVLLAAAAMAQTTFPDFSTGKYTTLRKTYEEKVAETGVARAKAIEALLKNKLKDAQEQAVKARVSGNNSRKADASEFAQIVQSAAASFAKDGAIALPERTRPGNTRAVDAIRAALKSADNTRDDALAVLASRTKEELRLLLIADKVNMSATATILDEAWEAFLAAQPGAGGGAEGGAPSGPIAADPADGGEETVYARLGESSTWRRFVRIDITVSDMELFSIPLFPMEAGKTNVRGKGMTGSGWTAVLTAPAAFPEPKKAMPMRLKSVEGKAKIDVVTWPNPGNNWTFELRARPEGTPSHNACLVEIGE